MARYYSDLDDGKTRYVDTVGTELPDIKMVPSEAIGFLTAIAKDIRDDADRTLVVNVRNERGQVIFTTMLTLQSDWLDTGYAAKPPGPSYPSPDATLHSE
jgi:hypothetical protein